ncbi:SDR family oxidoreductase [Ktedonosporobacter rubrisoli]|uniref:SDR family oxidoreductase n=1 Tax=Ktedonosporobacter rubrisoli TaxID=2509675 RepID=A0A4P6JQB4_KTERU|nr:SDR family oxidoreductase [Ktedonosporobacter rubrisoli]QBD76956.1 SDR family oxidoreductase [Ktedonosporobacter rubrisoli]
MISSYVVTGGGQGIGRAVVERLLDGPNCVVVIERSPEALTWIDEHPAGQRVLALIGDASDNTVTEQAADLAQSAGAFSGWVNNAALFRDASLHAVSAHEMLDLISLNLSPVIAGCQSAIRRFLAAGTPGAIVNLSSHQARQAVPGCTPYVTAKAAIEGLTRALAVEYAPHGIRVNAVAPGSVETERYKEFLQQQEPEVSARIEQEMRLLHPPGRIARAQEVAAAIVYLLSAEASFINGATVPVDGGRSVLAHDPESLLPLS